MKRIVMVAMTALFALPFMAFPQSSTSDMTMATLSEKMETLGQEMEKLGTVMESYGTEMEKYGKELEKSNGKAPKAEQKMEELGDKMGKLGDEMGKLGDEMGRYGERMGKLHQQMMNWFFHELRADQLIPSLNGKARIIFDEKGLDVNGEKTSNDLFRKYKMGFEKYWGKALKPDFLFWFKGTISEENGNVKTDGNMNSDF